MCSQCGMWFCAESETSLEGPKSCSWRQSWMGKNKYTSFWGNTIFCSLAIVYQLYWYSALKELTFIYTTYLIESVHKLNFFVSIMIRLQSLSYYLTWFPKYWTGSVANPVAWTDLLVQDACMEFDLVAQRSMI